MSQSGNYQDSVTAPLSHAFDDEAVGKDNEDEQDEVRLELDPSSTVLSAVEKACSFNPKLCDMLMLFSIASKNFPCDMSKPSTQAELANSAICITGNGPQQPLVLILDVKTRWSSTHQMMHEHFSIVFHYSISNTLTSRSSS